MRKFRAVPGEGIYASEGTVMLPERLELQLQDFAQAYNGVDYTDIHNLSKNWSSMNDSNRKKIKKLLSAIRRSCNETGLDPYELAREYPEDKATCDELVALITSSGKSITATQNTKRDIMELPTSNRCDLINQMIDESAAYFISTETAMKWLEDHGWDTSNYSNEQFNSDWDDAAEMSDREKYEGDDYEDEDDDSIDWIETRADARRWLNEKQKEYGSTYFFPDEERYKLDRLIEKFGSTYFWDREALED